MGLMSMYPQPGAEVAFAASDDGGHNAEPLLVRQLLLGA